MIQQILSLFKKEWQLEWRSKNAVAGILLYVIITVFVAFRSFGIPEHTAQWNSLFWIILVFSAIHAVQKTFISETKGQKLYFYTLANPIAVILSKIIYNVVMMMIVGSLTFLFYIWFMGGDFLEGLSKGVYFSNLILGFIGFAAVFTFMSAISSQTSNNIGVMAVLSFPLVLPMVILLLNIAQLSLQGFGWDVAWKSMLALFALDLLVIVLASILFPFVWKD